MTPLDTPATVVPAVTASVADPATAPTAAPAAAVAAPPFGLVFFVDLLLLFLLPLLRWLRCSTGSPVQTGRASLERVLADCLEVTRVRETVFEVTTEQPYLVLDGLSRRWNQRRWCDFLLFPVPDTNG